MKHYLKMFTPLWMLFCIGNVESNKWSSLVVRVESSSCGTLVHYDGTWAYVIGCGHPFTDEKEVLIETFHQKQGRYQGELLFHKWDGGIHDISLIRFKPDWVPKVAKIPEPNFNPDPGRGKEADYHSVGCDGYTVPTDYIVRFLWRERRVNGLEQLCCEGKAMGGRSGGGLLTDDGTLIGIASRTSRNRVYYSSFTQIYRLDKKYHFIFGKPKEENANIRSHR